MTWRKGIIVGGIVVLALLVLVPALAVGVVLLTGQEQRRGLVEWVAGQALDTPVAIGGPFELRLGRTARLSAAAIELGAPESPTLPGLHGEVGQLRVQVELPALLRARLLVSSLALGDAELVLVTSEAPAAPPAEAERPAEDLPLPPVLPALVDVEVSDFALRWGRTAAGEGGDVKIDRLRLREPEGSDISSLDAALAINGVNGVFSGEFGTSAEAMAPTKPYPITMRWQRSGLELGVSGTMEQPVLGRGADLTLELTAADVALVGDIPGLDLPELGPLQASARVRGDTATSTLEDIRVFVQGPQGPRLTLAGRIDALHRLSGMDLTVSAALADAAILRDLAERAGVTAFAGDVSELSFAARILGSLDRLQADDVALRVVGGDKRRLTIEGKVDDILAPAGVDLKLAAQTIRPQGLRELLSRLGVRLSPTFARVSGRVHDDTGVLRLDELDATASDISGININATGFLELSGTWQSLKPVGMDIRCKATAPDSRGLARLLGWQLPDLGPLAGRFAFVGDGRDLDLADLDAATSGGGPIQLRVTARALRNLLGRRQDRELQELEIAVESDRLIPLLSKFGVTTRSADSLFQLVDYAVPDPGPFAGSASLSLRRDNDGNQLVVLENVQASLGQAETWQAMASGRVGAITTTGPLEVGDIDGVVTINLADVQAFAAGLGLPPGHRGTLEVSADVDGAFEALRLSKLKVQGEFDTGLAFVAQGSLDALSPRQAPHLFGLELDIAADAPTTAALSPVIDQVLPELGAVRGTGQLSNRDGTIALKQFDLGFGPETAESLSATGQVRDLDAFAGVGVEASFTADLGTLLAPYVEDPPDVTMPLVGVFSLSDADGSLGVDVLNVRSEPNPHLHVDINGSISDLAGLQEVDVDVLIEADDVNALSPELTFGPVTLPHRRLRIHGQASGSDGRAGLTGHIEIGETSIDSRLELRRIGDRLKLSGKLQSDRVDLADLGWALDEAPAPDEPAPEVAIGLEMPLEELLPTAAPVPTGPRDWVIPPEPLPFDALEVLDLDLLLRVGEMYGRERLVESLNTDIRLDRGRLLLVSSVTGKVGGRFDSHLEVDAAAGPPTIAYQTTFHDVHAESFGYLFGDEDLVRGQLRGEVDIAATGRSPRELATTLGGSLEVELGEGRLNAGDLRLLSPDLFWVFTLLQRRQYTDFTCGLFRFEVEQGVARSNTMLLMLKEGSVAAAGEIDLAQETLNIAIAASGRRVLPELSKPFRVHGTWQQPRVRVGSVGLLADTALNLSDTALTIGAKLVTTPLRAVGSLGERLFGARPKPEQPAEQDEVSACVQAAAESS